MQDSFNKCQLIYISPSSIPSLAANSVHVLMQADALKSTDYSISLFCRTKYWSGNLTEVIRERYGIKFKSEEINALFYPFDRGSTLAIAIFAFFKLFWQLEKKYLISRNLYFSFFWTVLLGRSAIYETHQVERGFGEFMQKLVLINKKTHIVVISEKLKEILEEKYDHILSKCTVLHDAANDINIEQSNEPSEVGEFVSQYKNENGFSAVVGYFGHLYAGRGLDIILDLAPKNPDSLFVVCGGNPDQVVILKRQRVEPNLLIVGHQPYLDSRQLMGTCDVLLMPYQRTVSIGPTDSDTSKWMSPMKMFEYMVTGKPIISSNLEVLKEILVDSENALLVEPDKSDEWHSALDLLRSDRGLAKRIGDNARRLVLSEHTWTLRAERIVQILEGV